MLAFVRVRLQVAVIVTKLRVEIRAVIRVVAAAVPLGPVVPEPAEAPPVRQSIQAAMPRMITPEAMSSQPRSATSGSRARAIGRASPRSRR